MNERRHFPLFLLPFFSSLIVLSPVSNALLPLDKEEEDEEEKKKGKPRFCMGVSPAGQIAEAAARLKAKMTRRKKKARLLPQYYNGILITQGGFEAY